MEFDAKQQKRVLHFSFCIMRRAEILREKKRIILRLNEMVFWLVCVLMCVYALETYNEEWKRCYRNVSKCFLGIFFVHTFHSLPLISTFRFDNILSVVSCFVTSILLHFMWTFNVLFTQCYYFLVLCGFLFRFSQMLLFHILCFWLLLSNFQFIFMHLLYHW